MSWMILKALKEQRAEAHEGIKALRKKADEEKRDYNESEAKQFDELTLKFEKLCDDIKRCEKEADFEKRMKEDNEQRRQQPGRDDLDTPEKRAEAQALEVRKAFDHYLRHGMGGLETRALTVSGVGGVVGDRPFWSSLIEAQKAYTGVRQCNPTIIPSSDGNTVTIPVLDDTSNQGQILGEGVTDNSAADPGSGFISLGGYRFDSRWLKLSLELVQDSAFPVEATILSMAGERIGRSFNNYSTTGTGIGQPKGFVTSGTTGKVAVATNAVTYDEIVDFCHSLDPAYRQSGKVFVQMHDTTLAAVRKLKNGLGQYIWTPGEAGAPNSILGFPYVVNNSMAQLTSGVNSVVMAIGDFSRYFIKDVANPYIVRADELFIGDGMIGYRVFQRMDAALADTNAVKLLKTAAS